MLNSKEYIGLRARALAELDQQMDVVDAVATQLKDTLVEGGTIYVVGNGGSLSQAEHFAGEVYKHRVVALTNPATLTAIANDFTYDSVFNLQISQKITPKDTIILLSTSGLSSNVVDVASELERPGDEAVGFILVGGNLSPYWDDYDNPHSVIALGDYPTPVVQEMTLMVLHRWADAINDAS